MKLAYRRLLALAFNGLFIVLIFSTHLSAEEGNWEYLHKYSMLSIPYKVVMDKFSFQLEIEAACRYCGQNELADAIEIEMKVIKNSVDQSIAYIDESIKNDSSDEWNKVAKSVVANDVEKAWIKRAVSLGIAGFQSGLKTNMATILESNPNLKKMFCSQASQHAISIIKENKKAEN